MFLFKAYSRIEFFFLFFCHCIIGLLLGSFIQCNIVPCFDGIVVKKLKRRRRARATQRRYNLKMVVTGYTQRQVLAVIVGLWAGKQEENGSAHSKGYLKMENPSVLDRFTWHHYSTTDEKFSVLGYCNLINGLYLLASCCVRVCFALCLLLICSWSLSLFCLLSHSTCSLNVLMKDRQVISVRASALTDVL